MLNLLANVNANDVIAYANSVPFPQDYLLTRPGEGLVPETKVNSVKYRIKSTTRYQNAAKFRAYDTETPFGRREVTHQVTEGILPPVGQKLFVGELETILLSLSRGADDQELVDAIYNDTENNVQAIRARMELAAGDMLTDGKFTLTDENGLTLEADYGVPAGFLPTAGTYWTVAATATPISDELAWIQYMVDNGEGRPVKVLTAAKNVALMASAKQYQEAYFHQGLSAYPTLSPLQVNSVRASYNLPPIETYDTQVRVDGTNVRTIPDNRWILVPGVRFAETQYGVTAEAIALSRTGNPRITREDLPGIIVTTRETDDPVQVWTKGSAVAMPLLFSPKSYLCAKIAA